MLGSGHPTFPGLLMAQCSQVQRGHFGDKALWLVGRILSPGQFGVRETGMLLNLHGRALQEQSQCPQIATAQQNLKMPAAIPFLWDATPQATAMDAPSTKNNPIAPGPLDLSWWLACKKRPSICTRELFFGDKRSDDFLGLFLLAADSKQYFY